MDFALSTNWCSRRLESGEEIVDAALSLGFTSLELGYLTTGLQAKGFRRRLDEMPVGSVHAFCPVPISAPQGHPELYALASFDAEARKMAHFQVARNIRFAAEMGADALVLHMGRVACAGWFSRWDVRRRVRRGRKMLDVARRELAALLPDLERSGVTLALENLPYLEGFPAEWELMELLSTDFRGAPVRGWFDTGHDRVRAAHGWQGVSAIGNPEAFARRYFAGMHINDVVDRDDDHLAPGMGNVDFAALAGFARGVRHLVFEPNASVSEGELREGVRRLSALWRQAGDGRSARRRTGADGVRRDGEEAQGRG